MAFDVMCVDHFLCFPLFFFFGVFLMVLWVIESFLIFDTVIEEVLREKKNTVISWLIRTQEDIFVS